MENKKNREAPCIKEKANRAKDRRGYTYEGIVQKLEQTCDISIEVKVIQRAIQRGFGGRYAYLLKPYATILDIPVDLFIDPEVCLNEFDRLILSPTGTIYESILHNLKDISELKQAIKKRSISETNVLEYISCDTKPKGLRQKSTKLLLSMAMEEEFAFEISKSSGVKTVLVKEVLRNLSKGKEFISERVVEELFATVDNSLNKYTIELLDKLINEEKAYDSSIYRSATALNRENRIRCIRSTIKANDIHRVEILSLQKHNDYHTVRDEIAEFLCAVIESDTYYSDKEKEQCKELMTWVIHEAAWKPEKQIQDKKLRYSIMLETLRQNT